ncbi:hypothetical protein CJF42_08850 [Pseudoalteromonas sp. NBT06-2]|uniref:hypothetical protein n=1 Tax=Pseudoalteromonas sp. NBT06-2 TaxID=2025950 RepID=UPI000BA540FA|nr:hypothetical protein [Pseudoalteromonas sp. NBT06-2]PAJ74778.1 hypothetical protein CJF42_08850 [Pseudoalteromonas sp. NBT06-2]
MILSIFNYKFSVLIVLIFLFKTSFVLSKTLTFHKEQERSKQQESVTPKLVIEDIVCKGNLVIDCDYITKKFYQNIGDILDSDKIADARYRLNALIQFNHVTASLKKGHTRGYAIIVFEVTEASNIVYSTGIGFQKSHFNNQSKACDGSFIACYPNQSSVNGLNNLAGVSISHLNFLGMGKEVSFSINGDKSVFKADFGQLNLENLGVEGAEKIWDIDASDKTLRDYYDVDITYYDPHFLDLSHYFLSGLVRWQKVKESNTLYTELIYKNNEAPIELEPNSISNKNINKTYALSVGRRFARYSHISFGVSGHFKDESGFTKGVLYGWDSTDHPLFATRGSTLKANLAFGTEFTNSSISYQRNINVFRNHIFTFGGYAEKAKFDNNLDLLSKSLSVGYKKVSAINMFHGEFSAWQLDLAVGKSSLNDYSDTYKYSINGSYTFQSSSFIFRFSLGYHDLEIKNL